MRNSFFGAPWPSGVCDDGEQVETPVGQICMWCDEAIIDGDQGTFIAVWTEARPGAFAYRPQHRECSLRSVLGSIGHLTKTCSCYKTGDEVFEDPPGLSRREAALEVWEYVTVHGIPA